MLSGVGRAELEGRVAIVTGGSRGIGFATAQELAARGAQVVISSRRKEELDDAVARLNSKGGENVIGLAAHAGRQEDIDLLVKTAMDRFGAIDILIVNAGTNPYMGTTVDIDIGAWDKVFEVNVRGAFLLIQAATRAWMYEHGGSIVTIASTAGLHPSAGLGTYGVSKAALIQLTKQLAFELADRKIRLNAVAPGVIQTRFAEALWKEESTAGALKSRTPMARIGTPDEVAGAVAFLASDAASYITGSVLTIDGGLTLA